MNGEIARPAYIHRECKGYLCILVSKQSSRKMASERVGEDPYFTMAKKPFRHITNHSFKNPC